MPEHDGTPANTAGAPLPQPQVDRASHWLPSLVWLLPLLAALVGIGLVAKSYFDEGPTVVVSFRSGEGLEAGKTKVKYKDVDVGQVRAISLSPDLSKVLVTIDMNKDARRFTAADTRFWVVKPRIGVSGVSGLGTLLSGAYIGVDAAATNSRAWKKCRKWRATRKARTTRCTASRSVRSTPALRSFIAASRSAR